MASSKEAYTTLDLRRLKEKTVCLTLDVEQDYGDLLDEPSYEGLKHIPDLVNFCKQRNIPLTCFVQGSLFETQPAEIKRLAELDVDFELHSYSHPRLKEMNVEMEIKKGKEAYCRFFDREPMGYRSPLGSINNGDYETLAAYGFKFDSSLFPSFRPGVFNNLRGPTKPYRLNTPEIIEFPVAVLSQLVRIPIALGYIKLLGKPYLYLLKRSSLPGLIVFGFHLHDLFNLSSSNKIPLEKFPFIYRRIFKRIYQGEQDGLMLLDELIRMFQRKGYTFLTLKDVYEAISTK